MAAFLHPQGGGGKAGNREGATTPALLPAYLVHFAKS